MPVVAPTDYPEYDSAFPFGSPVVEPLVMRINYIAHDDIVGDEQVDVFIRPDGGAWSKWKSALVNWQPGQFGTVSLHGLDWGTLYDVALRFRRLQTPTVGYEGDDPDAWTAADSKGQFTTPILAPHDLAGVWARTSASDEQITLTWTNTLTDLPLRVYRGANLLADLPAGSTQYVHDTDHGTLPLVGEVTNTYNVRYYTPAIEGEDATVNVWSGPIAPTITDFQPPPVARSYTVNWTNGDPNAFTEVTDDYPGDPASPPDASPGATSQMVSHGIEVACGGSNTSM